MTVLARFAADRGIRHFLFSFCDLFGVQRAKLVPASAVAQLEASGAGFAGFAAWLDLTPADADVLARPDAKPGLVQVGGDQALAVVDHRQPALVVESGLGKADPPGRRSQDRRSLGRGEVGAEVRGHGLTVEDALASKAAGHPIGL
jgi:hypothetical protein